MSRSTRPKNNRIYDESTALLEPIRFITARRFWILVYMLLGSTGLAMLIARFLIRPIVGKVLRARQEFQAHVDDQIRSFVTNLAKSITALPGRQIIVDTNRHRLYVNTETQTDSADTAAADSSIDEEADKDGHNKANLTRLSVLAAKLGEFGQDAEESLYSTLGAKMSDLKTYLYEFESYSYKSSYTGFGAGGSGNTTPGGEAIQKFKAEIRSVKGSLLNARTFTSSSHHKPLVAT